MQHGNTTLETQGGSPGLHDAGCAAAYAPGVSQPTIFPPSTRAPTQHGLRHAAARFLTRTRRRLWMKYAMRTGGLDDSADFDLAYGIDDPWHMDSPTERARFEATNRIIEGAFGRVGSVLELGCGEGHQTAYLARISERQYGIDISARAIARARLRVPAAQFADTDVFHLPWDGARHRYDLVTACEVLYCLKDPGPTLDRMRHLGRCGLVTVFAPAGGRIGPYLERIDGLHKAWFAHGKTTWLVGWWRDA